MRTHIPSLQALLAFEAAARHLSFTKAAQELQLTQTAISHQIRNLEDQLGIKLFVRQRNSLLLTTAASEYLESVSSAIDLLSKSTESVQTNQANVVLTIACLPTYAIRCLIPALPDFQDRNPDITVHVETTTNFDELDHPAYDVAIRYGAGNWPAASRVDLLRHVEIFPVCSPTLIAEVDAGSSERQLLSSMRRLRTFYHSMYQDDWPSWAVSSGLGGIAMKGEAIFNSPLTALEAAVAGGGAAMGRTPIVDSYLKSGRLVAPFKGRMRSNVSFYLTSPMGKARSRKVELFRDWALSVLGEGELQHRSVPSVVGREADMVQTGTKAFRPVGELLARWKSEFPDKLALLDVTTGQRVTFLELSDAVDSVSLQLLDRGVGKGDRVLLDAPDCIEKLVLWFALWRLSAVVCPIELARQRTAGAEQACNLIRPDLILLGAGSPLEFVPTQWQKKVCRSNGWDRTLPPESGLFLQQYREDSERLPPEAGPYDLAGICLSSGTTGDPKCVLYDHSAYWLNGAVISDALGLTSADRTLEYRSFDWYSTQILSLVPFLQAGLTMHIAARYSRTSFARWISHHQITVSVGVPAVINLLLQYPDDARPEDLTSLRFLTCSTASLSTSKWIRFEQLMRVRVLNIYGSTEAGWICSNRHNDIVIGSVGRPLPGVELEVKEDDRGGANTPGELLVAGPQLAVGILGADGAIQPLRGRRLATHDLGVLDERGRVRLAGRTDDLIIRGGTKIPPREIEEVVLMHPEVIDAAVIGVPDEIFGQVPVCFYAPRSDFPADELLSYCARNLPRERCPTAARQVSELPRNARGKLLYRELQAAWERESPRQKR